MKVKLIIPRHKYRSLKDGRKTFSLSPAGTTALRKIATCSESAAADLAIRMLAAIAFGSCRDIELVYFDLANALGDDDDLVYVSKGLEILATMLDYDANLKIELSDEN